MQVGDPQTTPLCVCVLVWCGCVVCGVCWCLRWCACVAMCTDVLCDTTNVNTACTNVVTNMVTHGGG